MTSTELTTKIDNFKVWLVKMYWKELNNFFAWNEEQMKKYMSSVVYSINKCPTLLNDLSSLTTAVIELAQTWLAPWPTQEAYILPYKWKATAMIGYQGWVRLLNQAWFTKIVAEIVFENDIFEYELWSSWKIIHKVNPKLAKEERWEAIGCYVIIWDNSKYMNIKDIYKFRDKYSQSYKSKDWKKFSPWMDENDPEMNMVKKTVLKQLIKYIRENWARPINNNIEQIGKALDIDNKEAPVNWEVEIITWPQDLDPNTEE